VVKEDGMTIRTEGERSGGEGSCGSVVVAVVEFMVTGKWLKTEL
jgi:hypothetical protein